MGRKTKIHRWLYSDEVSENFLMLPPDLFEEPAFQDLSHAARLFYIVLCVHKETQIQRSCLYLALKEYNEIYDLGLTEKDLSDEAKPNKHTKESYTHNYFVAPVKQLAAYGYKKNYVTKLKKELIDKGFIQVKYGQKGKYNGWNENVTVYQFSDKWKAKRSTP